MTKQTETQRISAILAEIDGPLSDDVRNARRRVAALQEGLLRAEHELCVAEYELLVAHADEDLGEVQS